MQLDFCNDPHSYEAVVTQLIGRLHDSGIFRQHLRAGNIIVENASQGVVIIDD